MEPSLLHMLQGIFPLFLDQALGVPNVGKTPLGSIIAMAMSRCWVKKLGSENLPGYREASEFDFFRGKVDKTGPTSLMMGPCQTSPCAS